MRLRLLREATRVSKARVHARYVRLDAMAARMIAHAYTHCTQRKGGFRLPGTG